MSYDFLRKSAAEVLKNNVFSGEKDTGYTAPSGKIIPPGERNPRFLYPFQWLWDTFFIAAWSENTTQSVTDISKFIASQQPDGFLGHIRYNREILENKEYFPPPDIYYERGILPAEGELISKITQPPNPGYGLLELAKKLPGSAAKNSFLKNSFDAVFRYHEWLFKNMTIDGLLITTHPWEAGTDNSPVWDSIYKRIHKEKDTRTVIKSWLKQLQIPYERVDTKLVHHTQRPIDPDYDIYLYLIYLYGKWGWDREKMLTKSPFRVQDPTANAILVRSNAALLELAQQIGEPQKRAEQIRRWLKTTTKGLDSLWDKERELYFAKDLNLGEFVKIETVSSYVPLFSRVIPQNNADALYNHLKNLSKEKTVNYIVPSTAPGENQYFDPNRYWRGPVWVIMNELIAEGLQFYKYPDLAKKIRDNSLKLVADTLENRGGFYEYYNPSTGRGLGSPLQSWTAAAVLKILNEK